MDDRETGKGNDEERRGGEAAATPFKELLDAHELAGQLEQLLGQEAHALKRFDNEQLLKILHRKDSLVRELAARIKDFEKARNRHPNVMGAAQYRSFKTRLREIDKLNRSNQAFIQGTLSHYQHFLDCLCPSGYHPRRASEPRQELAAFKGLTFRKEV